MKPEPGQAETAVKENGPARLKPYRRPTVRPLGNLQELTRGGQGSMNDAVNRHNWKPY